MVDYILSNMLLSEAYLQFEYREAIDCESYKRLHI